MLWITHCLAAFAGGLVVYLTMTYPWKDPTVTSETRQRIKGGVFAIALSLFLVGAGIQAFLANQASDRFRDQQTCLNHFAADLASTLNARVQSNAKLADATGARNEAADRVITIVALGRRKPPEATEVQFDAALESFVKAKVELEAVQRQVDSELARNPYPKTDTPQAVCSR